MIIDEITKPTHPRADLAFQVENEAARIRLMEKCKRINAELDKGKTPEQLAESKKWMADVFNDVFSDGEKARIY